MSLRERLVKADATDPMILENDELLEVLTPALLADFRLADEYQYAASEPLTTPIVAIVTTHVARNHSGVVAAWAVETSGQFVRLPIDTESFFSADGWRRLGQALSVATATQLQLPTEE